MSAHNELFTRILSGTCIGLLLSVIYFYTNPIFFSLLLSIFLFIILATEMPRLLNYKKIRSWIITLLYPIMPFIMLITLNNQPKYHFLVFLIFILSFAHDIGAYFTGIFLGKHLLCPTISPKKTWEGFFGGLLLVFIIMNVILRIMLSTISVSTIPFFCLTLSTAATLGDLFESWLKRKAGIKDAGILVPGHGGLLDRFDSIFAVTILVYFGRNYLLTFFGL